MPDLLKTSLSLFPILVSPRGLGFVGAAPDQSPTHSSFPAPFQVLTLHLVILELMRSYPIIPRQDSNCPAKNSPNCDAYAANQFWTLPPFYKIHINGLVRLEQWRLTEITASGSVAVCVLGIPESQWRWKSWKALLCWTAGWAKIKGSNDGRWS